MKRINLLPDYLKEARARRRERVIYAAVTVGAMVVLAGWASIAAVQVRSLDRQIAEADRELEPWRERAADIEDLHAEHQQLHARLGTLRNLREPVSPAPLLALLTRLAPEDAVLRSLVIENPALSLYDEDEQDIAPPDPVRIELEGLVPDDVTIGRLVRVLGDGGVFRSIRLADSNEVVFRDQPGHQFRITMRVPLTLSTTATHADGAVE